MQDTGHKTHGSGCRAQGTGRTAKVIDSTYGRACHTGRTLNLPPGGN